MKRIILQILFGGTALPSWAAEAGVTVLRVFAGLSLALAHGMGKLPGGEFHERFMQGVEGMGFPAPTFFGWMALLSEFLGGLCLALGLGTRVSAFLIICTMSTAAFLVHAADPYVRKEMALLYLMIALAFLLKGAGRLSVDALIRPRRAPGETRGFDVVPPNRPAPEQHM